MKTKELTYEEAKQLILQGYSVKLPPWKGYWTKSTKGVGGIEVHLKNGDIVYTPDIKYTFYDNWEIATSENCEVLRKEIEANKTKKNLKKPDIKILDYSISPVTNEMTVKVLFKDTNELKYLTFDEFISITDDNLLEGEEKILNRIINEIVILQSPPEEQDTVSKLLNNLQGLLEILDETEIINFLDMVSDLPDSIGESQDSECNCLPCQHKRILEKGIENNVNPLDVLAHLKKAIDNYNFDN